MAGGEEAERSRQRKVGSDGFRAVEAIRRAPFSDSPLVGERGANTQRTILAAALEVFGARGFHDTGVELITEVAGCSRPSFYQYFSSKEDVFWHLARDLAAAIGAVVDRLGDVDASADGVEHLAEWLDELVDVYQTYAPIFAAFPAAVRWPDRSHSTVLQSTVLGDSQSISARLGVAIMASMPPMRRPSDLPALPSITVSIVLRSINFWLLGVGGMSRRRFVTGLARTLHRLFHGLLEGVNAVAASPAPSSAAPSMPTPPGRAASEEPRRARGRETRDRLLAAGAEVLPELGYHGTRIADIVARADVSHGSFYRYFSTKDALFGVLAERTATRLFDLLTAFPNVADPDALEPWFSEYFESYRQDGGVISVWQEIDYKDPAFNEYSLRVATTVYDRLERIVHARGFGDHSVDALVLLAIIERVPYSVQSLRFVETDAAIAASSYFVRHAIFGSDLVER